MKRKQKALSLDTLIMFIQGEIAREGTQKELAEKWGISQQYLNDVIRYRREPGEKILRAMGLKRVSLYVDETNDNIPELAKDIAIETVG